MECHKCLRSEAVAAGKYRRVAFAKTPCAACELRETSQRTIAFDDEHPSDGVVEDVPFPEELPQEEERVPLSLLSDAVAEILSMPVVVRDVVSWRFAGMTYREIGAALGMTEQAVDHRLRNAMRKWPSLRALFALKAAKQERRRGICRTAGGAS